MDKKTIEERAERVLSVYGYNKAEAYIDSVKLAGFFGFRVYQLNDLPESEDGSIYIKEQDDIKEITVNNNRSLEAKRFIIVHELAHYLLHYKSEVGFLKHRENIKGKNLEENDADYLAACILMPEESFKSRYNSYKKIYSGDNVKIIEALKKDFQTPDESIERRIQETCV